MPIAYKIRDSDIVDNENELAQSVVNNVATFFDTLPPKFQYEIHFVTSVTLGDGTIQTGGTQRVQTGNYANGTPKYKTIVNKFAVMDVYIVLPGVARKKLQRLVLAPVNILNYNKTTTELAQFSANIPSLLKYNTLPPPSSTPVSSQPAPQSGQTTAPPPPQVTTTPSGVTVAVVTPPDTTGDPSKFKYIDASGLYETAYYDANRGVIARYGSGDILAYIVSPSPNLPADWFNGGQNSQKALSAYNQIKNNPVPSTAPGVKLGASAVTLFDWYTANNQNLPSVAERGVTYENFGLGPRSTYVGTAEQNNALLMKLKQ